MKKRRTCYPTGVAKCTVSYRDRGGVEHVVKVDADSLFEAAGIAIDRLTAGDPKDGRPNLE